MDDKPKPKPEEVKKLGNEYMKELIKMNKNRRRNKNFIRKRHEITVDFNNMFYRFCQGWANLLFGFLCESLVF